MHTFWQQCLDILFPLSDEARIFRYEDEDSILQYYQPRWSERHLALSRYQNPVIRALIAANKFQANQQAHQLLAHLLAKYLDSYKDTEFILLPIPLVLRRKHKRGYNQVEVVLDNLPKQYQKKIYKGYLRKTAFTQPQTDLDREDRLKNVKNTLYCRTLPTKIKNTTILIVDDVLTTGATLKEARRTVKEAVPKGHGIKIQTIALAH